MHLLFRSPIYWTSKKKWTILHLTWKAEYISVRTFVQANLWLQRLLNEISPTDTAPPLLFTFNSTSNFVVLNYE